MNKGDILQGVPFCFSNSFTPVITLDAMNKEHQSDSQQSSAPDQPKPTKPAKREFETQYGAIPPSVGFSFTRNP